MIRRVALVTLLLSAAPAAAAEKRCGWLHNPGPGNWWLTDRDGEWTLTRRGERPPRGLEQAIDMRTAGWKKTNGSYGYGCSCLTIEADPRGKRVTRVYTARSLPLRSCRMDKRLPKP
jgi:hypothetical protein